MRECATALLHVAKREKIPVFLIGHVTKVMHESPSALPPNETGMLRWPGGRKRSRGIVNCFAGLDTMRASCSGFCDTPP